MRKKDYKGRCEKRMVEKCKTVCKIYDPIQAAYVEALVNNPEIAEIKCNVAFESSEMREYMTDFVCVKTDGDLMVRECVYRKMLTKPKTLKLLDASREYYLRRGIKDWGIVVDEQIDEER